MKELQHEVTRSLREAGSGSQEALDRLVALVYDQLRRMAHHQRLRWQGEATLNTTALVHEAYCRLAGGAGLDLESRRHFLRVAALAMRYILCDHAKARERQKRGGDYERVSFKEVLDVSEGEADRLIALDAALKRLAAINERQRHIVECRFFEGMTVEETARMLGLSTPTVKRGWKMARAWLYREIQPPPSS